MKIFIAFRNVVLAFALLVLNACSYQNELDTNTKFSKEKQAALYNTQLGLAYLNQGDKARARHKFLLALRQAPNDAAVNSAMGYLMEKSGEIEKARVYYHRAIRFSHGDGAQLNNYGAFLCRTGQYQQAETYFLQAVKETHYEYTALAYENAGLCALAIPDVVKARRYFAKALVHDAKRKQSRYELEKIDRVGARLSGLY